MRSRLVLLAVALLAVGCTSEPSAPPIDEELRADLASLEITYYLPAFDDTRVDDVEYNADVPGPVITYLAVEGEFDGYRVSQTATPVKARESVCRLIPRAHTSSGCHEDEGWAWSDTEGATYLVVVRGGTLLATGFHSLDDEQRREVATALFDAPEISAEDLAESSDGAAPELPPGS